MWNELCHTLLLTMADGARLQELTSKLHPLLAVPDLAIGYQPVYQLISNKASLVCCEVVLAVRQEPSHVSQPAQEGDGGKAVNLYLSPVASWAAISRGATPLLLHGRTPHC